VKELEKIIERERDGEGLSEAVVETEIDHLS